MLYGSAPWRSRFGAAAITTAAAFPDQSGAELGERKSFDRQSHPLPEGHIVAVLPIGR